MQYLLCDIMNVKYLAYNKGLKKQQTSSPPLPCKAILYSLEYK